MNWNSGFSALYELKKVDPVSWMDAGSFDMTGGTINKNSDSLIESADISMTESPGECWIRVYLKAKQGQDGARVALFTGLATAPQRALNGRRESYQVECYSVLKPADDMLLKRGYYVQAGSPGARLAADLLSVGPAPVAYDDLSPSLTEPIIAEDSDTNLSMAWKIVDSIGWRIRISGDGSIRICPKPTDVSAQFDAQDNDCIEMKITDTLDWFSAPNCYRATSGEMYAEVKDEDPDSPLSTVSRKKARGGSGEIWAQDTSAALNDGESLTEYTLRKLKEAQALVRPISYTRRFRPDVTVTDLVRLHLPGYGIDGTYTVHEQRITLGHGCRTQEEVIGS